jgi:trk system potassium uptake protein TrkH
MFIGGGSGGTAGGIKVTTFMLLLFAILAEVRGDPTVDAFGRQVPASVLRQALSVALLGVALVGSATLALVAISGLDLDRVQFEAVPAFDTVRLSTGITAALPPAAQYILIALVFIGRIGPITMASALALKERRKLFRLPEERPIVG